MRVSDYQLPCGELHPGFSGGVIRMDLWDKPELAQRSEILSADLKAERFLGVRGL